MSVIIMETLLLANLTPACSASADLTVDYLTWEPEHPISGGPLSIHVRINNAGNTISSDKYSVSLFIDDWWIDGWFSRLVGYQPAINPRVVPGRPEVWHFEISDYAIFKEGDHQIRAIVAEPSNPNQVSSELVKTLNISQGNYSSNFNIINYGMCNRIDQDGLPVGITENYSSKDEVATPYAYTDIKHADWPVVMNQKASLTFKFYSPNGTLHRERSEGYSVLLAEDPNGREITGFSFQLFITKDLQEYGTRGSSSYDPGYLALNKFPGIWRVEVLNENHLLFMKRFIIEAASNHSSSTVSPSESTAETELTSTTHGPVGQALGSNLAIIGVVVLIAVGAGAILSKRGKRVRSLSPSSPRRDSVYT